MSLFIVIAILLTAVAVGSVVFPLLRHSEDRPNAPVAATIMAVVLPAFVLLLYVSVSNHSWIAQSSVVAAEDGASAAALDEAVAALEDRLRSEPDDVEGWLLLGRTYFELQDVPGARAAFAKALALGGGTDAKLGIAEADIIMDRSNLTGEAGRLVEEVLLEEPDNQKALFFGGLVASARGDVATVRQRWETLLTMSPPPAIRKMLEEELASLPQSPGVSAGSSPAPAAGEGINVQVEIAANLIDKIKPGAMLFLVARVPDKPGPPLAAVRQGASNFPTVMRISDADAMLPGQSISTVARVHLIARIANGGDPIAQPGDIFGEVFWSRTGDDEQSGEAKILMDQVVE
jgi:cytochrome c-type biogenesis protein CcmH